MTNPKPALGDLDAKRLARAQARAARREAQGDKLPIVFGGRVIAELEAEFPLDTLEPLQDINLDMALLVQQAIANANATDAGKANVELVTNVLAANPDLPREFINAVKKVGQRLFGDSGYAAFVAARPTPWDVATLVTDIFSWYGLTLGEAWGSSTSPETDGGPSNTTSRTVSGSTPEGSGNAQEILDSWASADSLG
jgi:hypothetical protein